MKIKTKFIYPIAGFIALLPILTRADSVALSFTGGFNDGFFNTISGWGFSLSSPIVVTSLGFFDLDGAGLDNPHIITVWTSTGTQLVQTTVPIGTSTTLVDGFRYVAVPPTLLPAGDYIIGASLPENNPD